MTEQWGAGNKDKWIKCGNVYVGKREYPLILGEFPHSKSDNRFYAVTSEDSEPVGFSGEHNLIDVTFNVQNYYKDSYLSGDEIRSIGTATIYSDHIPVYEVTYRKLDWALIQVSHTIATLQEHSSNWLNKTERDKLVGRKIYYGRTSAIITSLIVEQGCIMIKTPNSEPFPPAIFDVDSSEDGSNWDEEDRVNLKTSVLDSSIWWFRRKLQEGEI